MREALNACGRVGAKHSAALRLQDLQPHGRMLRPYHDEEERIRRGHSHPLGLLNARVAMNGGIRAEIASSGATSS